MFGTERHPIVGAPVMGFYRLTELRGVQHPCTLWSLQPENRPHSKKRNFYSWPRDAPAIWQFVTKDRDHQGRFLAWMCGRHSVSAPRCPGLAGSEPDEAGGNPVAIAKVKAEADRHALQLLPIIIKIRSTGQMN